MTGNDQLYRYRDKSGGAWIRKISIDAGIGFRHGWRRTMTSNYESKSRQRRPGWVWVWAGLVIYFIFEAARLS